MPDVDVPIPRRWRRGLTAALLTLTEPGQSLTWPTSRSGLAQAASAAGLRGKYVSEFVENGLLRVWRTKE